LAGVIALVAAGEGPVGAPQADSTAAASAAATTPASVLEPRDAVDKARWVMAVLPWHVDVP
jgi:hypothetical protein